MTNLINYTQKTVTVTYNVQLSADKEFDNIIVSLLNVPKDKEVLVVPPKIKMVLRGGVDDLSSIGTDDLTATIDYRSIEKDSTGYVIPDIRLPLNMNLLKFEPEKFQYIIKSK